MDTVTELKSRYTWEIVRASIAGLTASVLALPVFGGHTVSPATPDLAEITANLTKSEQAKRSNVEEFSVVRRYVLTCSRMSEPAEMTVQVMYRKGVGKTFEVLQTRNLGGISRRVLERILAAEAESSRPGAIDTGSVTPDNYDFEFLGTDVLRGRPCYVLALHPKKKARFLVQGKAWIDAEDFAVAKIEGRLAASVSFWVSRPMVVQEFHKYGDFWMASHNWSSTDSRLFGKSELTVEYGSYDMQGGACQRVALRRASARAALD